MVVTTVRGYSRSPRFTPYGGPGYTLGTRGIGGFRRAANFVRRYGPPVVSGLAAGLMGPGSGSAAMRSVGSTVSRLFSPPQTRRYTQSSSAVSLVSPGAAGTKHFFRFRGRPPPFSKKRQNAVLPPIVTYTANESGAVINDEAKQNYGMIGHLYNESDRNAMSQFAGAGTFARERVIQHATAFGETILSNSTLQPCQITIYHIVPKVDCDNIVVVTPEALLKQLYADLNTNGVAGTASNYQIVGLNPKDLPSFNQYYTIVNTTDLILPAGGIHKETYTFAPNTSFDSELKYDQTLRKWDRFVMIRVKGVPEYATGDVTAVSLTSGRISWVSCVTYRYRVMEQSVVQAQFSDHLVELADPLVEVENDPDHMAPET